ncbi:MAG: SpoIID/LytB domain-containing protein [Candidatus Aminicenantia bacterium]
MKKVVYKHKKFIILLVLMVFSFGINPLEFAKEEIEYFRGFSIKKPIIRVGLGVNLGEIKIKASSGMKIYEINNGLNLLSDGINEALIKGKKEKLSEKFLVQLPPLREKEEAEELAEKVKTLFEVEVFIDQDLQMNTYQVWLGYFSLKSEAEDMAKELYRLGYKEAWIVEEEVTERKSKPFWIFFNEQYLKLSPDSTLYFIPSHRRSYLSYNERAYRGILIIKSTIKGVVLTNVLNMEDYLKGVVPNELSPYIFNEIEAQRAQAVAARTYATKNLGMYDYLGYDLCDTPKCQVYRGMSSESALSTRAVMETKGEVITYRGRLINALYTSTCGGSTEDAENVFLGRPVSYLKGAPCFYEHQKEWWLESKYLMVPVYVKGLNISPEIAQMISWGILPFQINHSFYRVPASGKEVSIWLENVLKFLDKKFDPILFDEKYVTFADLARLIVNSFNWQEKIEFLLKEKEMDYLLKELLEIKEQDKSYLAYLILENIFPIAREIKNPYRPLLKGEIIHYLYKIIDYSGKDVIHTGIFKSVDKDKKIELEENRKIKELTISPDTFLLQNNSGIISFTNFVSLIGGEKINWIEKDRKIQYLEINYLSFSNMLERSSIVNRWQVRKHKEELEKRIRRYYPIGELIDIIPKKRGVSGRVIELQIIGTENQVLVRGFRIRTVLDLREILFVIDREYDEQGNITHFIFTGRGWGHGIGLCQVGAYGMALAGANYKKIIKKYYQGVKIKKLY